MALQLGCMMPSVEGRRENAFAVGKRRRWKVSGQALEADHLELFGCVIERLQGRPFSPPQHPDIETQKGTRPKPLYSTLYFHSFSSDGHIHFTTSSSSLSILPCPFYVYTHIKDKYVYIYIYYIYMSSRKPADSLARNRLWSPITTHSDELT